MVGNEASSEADASIEQADAADAARAELWHGRDASPLPAEVTDVHVHVYPDAIAERAAQSVGAYYGVPMAGDGTVSCLRAMIAGSPIARCVIHSVAVKAKNVQHINDFIAATVAADPGRLVGFMTMHQDFPDPEGEIDRARALGLRGIKLHPDMQRVNMDDPRMMRVFAIAEDRGLPVIVHCGDYRHDFSHPRRLRAVLAAFPRLVVDAAHFGGWSIYEQGYDFLHDQRCYVDMSSSMDILGDRRTAELARLFGCGRVLFGSDYPMSDPAEVLRRFARQGLSASEMARMCHENAEGFLANELPLA